MNIIKRELRGNLKSLLIWSGCILLIIWMMFSEFSAYYNNEEMNDILDQFEPMLKALGMAGNDLTTVGGFLAMAAFYFYLLPGVYAGLLGSSIISKEERDKTTEFFLVLPISREYAILNKLIAAVINNVLLNLATMVGIIIFSMPYETGEGHGKFLLLLCVTIFIVQLIFLSIGMLLAAVMKRFRRSGTYTISILLLMYVLSIVSNLTESMDKLKYLTPFRFFEAGELLRTGEIDIVYLIISLCIIGVGIAGTFIAYPRRDVRI